AKLEAAPSSATWLPSTIQVSQAQADALAAAADQGKLAEVESMLQLPQDPDLPDSYGLKPLGRAAFEAWIAKGRMLNFLVL
ncbi:ANKRD50, partial [Symbiodinium microadriaticum]